MRIGFECVLASDCLFTLRLLFNSVVGLQRDQKDDYEFYFGDNASRCLVFVTFQPSEERAQGFAGRQRGESLFL